MYDITHCPLVSAGLLLGNNPDPDGTSAPLADFDLIVGLLATNYQLLPVGKAGCEHCHPTTYILKNQSFR